MSSRIISINTVMVDWLTLTSFDHPDFHKIVLNNTNELGLLDVKNGEYINSVTKTKRMQYSGDVIETDRGTVFYGAGMQNGRNHSMLQVSGEIANEYLGTAVKAVKNDWAKCTRIDIQSTVQEKDGWEQIRFFNRMKRKHRTASFFMSNDKASGKELATVYIGSRTSERLARVYQKMTESGVMLLRFEGEYKRHKADAIVRSLVEKTVSNWLLSHMDMLDDEKLRGMFSGVMRGISPHDEPASLKESDKTAEWLLSSALPAFERVINQHDGNGVAYQFLLSMKRAGILDID